MKNDNLYPPIRNNVSMAEHAPGTIAEAYASISVVKQYLGDYHSGLTPHLKNKTGEQQKNIEHYAKHIRNDAIRGQFKEMVNITQGTLLGRGLKKMVGADSSTTAQKNGKVLHQMYNEAINISWNPQTPEDKANKDASINQNLKDPTFQEAMKIEAQLAMQGKESLPVQLTNAYVTEKGNEANALDKAYKIELEQEKQINQQIISEVKARLSEALKVIDELKVKVLGLKDVVAKQSIHITKLSDYIKEKLGLSQNEINEIMTNDSSQNKTVKESNTLKNNKTAESKVKVTQAVKGKKKFGI